MQHDWDARYAEGDLPWDTGVPDAHLVRFIGDGGISGGRALEVGCGTGTNSVWLAEQGFSVVGFDVSPRAIEAAEARLARSSAGRALECRFEARDFLNEAVAGEPFDFVFDRGCLHTFDDAAARERFAAHVAGALAPGGLWLSLIGSTEGGPRETGPPRRTARDVVAAIEPVLEIVELRTTSFRTVDQGAPQAWFCLSRRRVTPAQPSTRRD